MSYRKKHTMNRNYYTVFQSLVMALLLSITGQAVQAKRFDTASEYYEDAVVLMSENSAAEAEIQLKNALQLDKNHLPSQILLGILYLKLGQNQRAEVELVKARNLGADINLIAVPLAQSMLKLQKYSKLERFIAKKNRSAKVESKLNILLGASYLSLNRHDDALQAYLEAERLDRNSIFPLMAQLNMAMGKSELEKAEELLSRLLEMQDKNPDILMKQAQLEHYKGNMSGALASYDKILGINPEHLNARVARAGLLQVRDGDHEWVVNELEPIINDNEDLLNPEITYIYVSSLLKLGRIDEARKMANIAKLRLNFLGPEILNQYPSLLFLEVSLAIYDGNLSQAKDSAERLLRITPSNSGSRMLLGQLYLEMNEADKALLALDPLYVTRAKDPLFLMLYGRALFLTGNPNDALYELENALAFGNTNRQVHVSLGMVRRTLGKLDEAISGLELAQDSYPDDVGIAVLLMDLYIEKKDSVSAEVVAQKMLKVKPDDHRIYDYLGRVSVMRREAADAITYFKKSIELGPYYTEAQINLARTYIVLGQIPLAEETLKQTLEIDNSNHDAMIAMAEISEAKGNMKQSIRWLERLHQLSPDSIPEALMLNRLYRRQSMYDEALRLAEKLFDKNSENFSVLVELIETLIDAQKTDDAVSQLNSSLKFATGFDSGQLLKLASLQEDVGDLKGATLTLEKCLYVSPDFTQAKIALVRLFTDMRDFDEATKYIEELKEEFPDKNIAYGMLGDIYLEQAQLEEAYQAFDKARQIEPSTELYKKLYYIEKELHGAEKAMPALKQWASLNPTDWNAQYAMALALIDVEDYQQSLELHKLLEQKSPENPLLMNNIAWLYQMTKNPGALDYITKAYQLYPENAAILDTYGWILTLENQADLGVGYLREALSRNSENPSIQYHLALALSELGRTKEASSVLEDLLKLKDSFSERKEAETLFDGISKS